MRRLGKKPKIGDNTIEAFSNCNCACPCHCSCDCYLPITYSTNYTDSGLNIRDGIHAQDYSPDLRTTV
jgi:putative bacteriocin precursor